MNYEIVPEDNIAAYECVHASYVRSQFGPKKDAIVVKELIHTKDGRRVPNLRVITNFQRDFYVTKELLRNHKDKRPYEDIKNLVKHTCSQHELHDRVPRALGRPGMRGSMRQIARSPYLYGTDIKTPVIIKRKYKDRYKVEPTPASYAVYDIETNMNSETEELIMSSITMKNKINCRVSAEWLPTEYHADLPRLVKELARELIGDIMDKRGVTDETFDVKLVNSPAACIVENFEAAHQWQPDYVGIFNMEFDIPETLRMLEGQGINPSNVFSDPRVPPEFRDFKWNQGPDKKVKKNDGANDEVPIGPVDRWHTCDTQASFIIADPMLLYKRIRTASANDPEYNLDYLLFKHGCKQKLKFSEADDFTGKAWHEFMQENYPIHYIIYNIYDCIATETLNEATGDISYTLPALLKCSEYKNFDSQPSMVADDYHFFLLKHNKVIASTSDQMLTEVDEYSPGLRGWIATLHAYLGPESDRDLVRDYQYHPTLIHTCVSDADIISTYPSEQLLYNIDALTTQTELSRVHGMEEMQWRSIGVDLTCGFNNHTMIAQRLLKLPSLSEVQNEWRCEMNGVVDKPLEENITINAKLALLPEETVVETKAEESIDVPF